MVAADPLIGTNMTPYLSCVALAAVATGAAAINSTSFTVDTSASTPWNHHWEECVGSGHAALTVRADWRAHLTRCRTELGVKRTRFHGLLDDDFTISLGQGRDDYVNLDSMVSRRSGLAPHRPSVPVPYRRAPLPSPSPRLSPYPCSLCPRCLVDC